MTASVLLKTAHLRVQVTQDHTSVHEWTVILQVLQQARLPPSSWHHLQSKPTCQAISSYSILSACMGRLVQKDDALQVFLPCHQDGTRIGVPWGESCCHQQQGSSEQFHSELPCIPQDDTSSTSVVLPNRKQQVLSNRKQQNKPFCGTNVPSCYREQMRHLWYSKRLIEPLQFGCCQVGAALFLLNSLKGWCNSLAKPVSPGL